MKTALILLFTFALTNAFYINDQIYHNQIGDYQFEDHRNEDHLERLRRDISYEKRVGNGEVYGALGAPETGGARGVLGYQGNLMDNNYGRLDGQGYASRTLGLPEGPQSGYGGRLDWSGSRGSASVAADHTRGLGTQFDAQAAGTIYQFNKNARIDGYGSYSRHYGGPDGASRPNYGVGAIFRGRF